MFIDTISVIEQERSSTISKLGGTWSAATFVPPQLPPGTHVLAPPPSGVAHCSPGGQSTSSAHVPGCRQTPDLPHVSGATQPWPPLQPPAPSPAPPSSGAPRSGPAPVCVAPHPPIAAMHKNANVRPTGCPIASAYSSTVRPVNVRRVA